MSYMTKKTRVADDRRIPEHMKSYAVTPSGKVYWNKRNARGQFVRWDGSTGDAEYDSYLEARHSDAERATRGNMVNRAGMLRGITGSDLLRPRSSLKYASEELQAWLKVAGQTLSYRDFVTQSVEKAA